MSLLRYPYTNLHELNLDWIIEQLGKDGPVLSVNDKKGIVTLTGEDINRSSNNPETVATALTSQGQSIQTVRTQIGVTPLPTEAQTLTGAIAENAQEIADIEDNVIGSTELPTEAQTLTGAIAENADNIGGYAESITNINNKIGNTQLPTTAQTLTGAIDELNGKIAHPSTVSYTTITASNQTEFEAGLTSAIIGMGVPDVRVCPCYANYSGSVTNGGQGIAFFSKISTSIWYVFIITTSSVKAGYYTGGTWNWL